MKSKNKIKFVIIMVLTTLTAAFYQNTVFAYCSCPNASNCTISASCSFAGNVDGSDNYTITINASQTLAVLAGQIIGFGTITNNGTFIINEVAANTPTPAMKKGYLYYIDADADNYAPNATKYFSTSSSWSGYRRVSLASGTNDCYDSNANAKPGQTSYFTSHRGDGSFDYDCNGSTDYQYGSTLYSCNQSGCDAHHYTVTSGWATSNPGCGVSGYYYTASIPGYCVSTSCSYSSSSPTQACR
jgi:hypothetical protein